jgi:hypothetical protein
MESMVLYRYSDERVIEDVRAFFLDPNHWAYREYGLHHSCSPEVPYHRKQIEVLFEERYWHWVTDRAIKHLIEEGFLRSIEGKVAKFVVRSDIRYYRREMKRREKVIMRYSNDMITRAIGDYAELLFYCMFRDNGFKVVGEHTNEYDGVRWTETNHDLDFIVERDSIVYGVEVKNTLPYMEREEFDVKLRMCKYLDIVPLWILRNAPGIQFKEIKDVGGFILKFKTQIYPPGQERLTRDIWNLMALPVGIWRRIPKKVENIFLRQHSERIDER